MNRGLENLERLYQKMQSRYGAQDTMVQQLWEELNARKMQHPEMEHWSAHYQRNTGSRPQADMQGR